MQKRMRRLSSLMIALAVIFTFLIIQFGVYMANFSELREALIQRAESLGEYLNTYKTADYELITSIGGEHRITLIDRDGQVLYDSAENAGTMENHANREEVMQALQSEKAEALRFSDTLRKTTWYYSVRLEDGRVLRVSAAMSSLLSSMLDALPLTLLLLFLLLILSFFVVSKATKRFIALINAIDLEHPDDTEIYDELAPFVTTIRKQNQTIRKQIQLLQEKQLEFSAITNNMQEGLLIVDNHGAVLSYNKSVLSLLSVNSNIAVRGANVFEFDRSEEFRGAVGEALQKETAECVIKKGGHYLQVNVSPVTQAELVQGVVVLVMDITEKHNREKLRREFTANVSHELKTPLTSISGYAEIMMTGIVKPEDVPVFSGKIYKEAGRMITMISDTILLSKLDEREQGSHYEPVDFMLLCENVVERLKPEAEKKGVRLYTDLWPASISGVRTVLDEMVHNLTENAIKYNKPGGWARVTLRSENGEILLYVADSGIGIPQKEQDRIFERFYRVEKGREETEGTGLGLSIVKHAAWMHGGEVEVQSRENKGTTMTVRLKNTVE